MRIPSHTPSLAALAAFAALVPAAASAQAVDFSWYGRIDIGLQRADVNDQTRTAINNYASRLGIKGERKFGAELSGLFQVETGVAPDDSANSNAFANRNSFLGLKSTAFGTLIAGTHDMPLKTLEGTTGIMWGEGDLVEILVHGRGTDQARGTAWTDVHTRRTNVLLYTSPKIAGALTAKLAYSPDETKGSATPPASTSPMSGLSLDYSQGMFFAGLATQSHKNAAAANPKMKATKLVVGAKQGAWSAGLAYSKLANGAATELETSNWVLTGSYALDSVVLKASFGKSGETSAANDDGISGLALQADYKLDDKTTLYGSFTRLTNAPGAQARFRGSDGFPTPAAGNDPRALGVGVRYNF